MRVNLGRAVRIGELAQRTGVPARMLRYYEEQGVLTAWRAANGYREYGEPAVERVLQVRELLEAGLPTRVIRNVLPCLEHQAAERAAAALNRTGEPATTCGDPGEIEVLRRQLGSIEHRIDILQRNHHAISTYLDAVASVTPA